MTPELENERTYVLQSLPQEVLSWPSELMKDIYLPNTDKHPLIRLRRRGETFFLTKKYRKDPNEASVMIEETIYLTKEEYSFFESNLPATKSIEKLRYKHTIDPHISVEVDLFKGSLEPLILLDIEWSSEDIPDFRTLLPFEIGKDVTDFEDIAGGMLAGKSYQDIDPQVLQE